MNKRTSILAIEHPFEGALARILFALLGLLLVGYLYFVSASVLNIMARKNASAELQSLQSSIAQMEKDYFTLSYSLSRASASSIGLAPLSGTSYIYRPGNAALNATADTIQRNAI